MAVVEDGEILELDKDEVIDLCSDGNPTPPPIYQSAPNVSPPPITSTPPALLQNPYTGGDPFLGPNHPQDEDHSPSVRFSRLRRSSALYRHAHNLNPSLSDLHSPLHSPAPPRKPVFERDPYPACNTVPSVIRESAPEVPNIPTHPRALSTHPPVTPLPSLPSSQALTWPRSAPPDTSPDAFHPPSAPHIPVSQRHDYDPERYAPNGDQRPFSDGPVYHAEPAPPPSLFYNTQHPPVLPMNTDSRERSFDVPRRRRTHTIPPPQEGSDALFNHETYASGIPNGHVFPTSNRLECTNGLNGPGFSYHAIHQVHSPGHRLVNAAGQVEKNTGARGRIQGVGLGNLSDHGPYNQRYLVSSHQGPLSGTLIERRGSQDEKDGERGKKEMEPRMSCFSDEEGQDGTPTTTRGESRGGCYNGQNSERGDDDSQSRSKASLDKKESTSRLSGDEASDGEIALSGIASLVVSLATVPDETPSPPVSTKKKITNFVTKKPGNFDAKKHLSELRRKALMSVKKRPAAKPKDESSGPSSTCPNPATATSTSQEALDGQRSMQGTETGSHKTTDQEEPIPASHDRPLALSDEFAPGFRIDLDSAVQIVVGGVRRTMTRRQFAEWQAWPYQNRVLVDYSSDSSDSDSGEASDDNDSGDDNNPKKSGEFRCSVRRNRKSEIEAMKIRMIRLGKCPSMLFGGRNESKGSKSSSSSVLVGKPEDESTSEKDDKTIVANSVTSQEQGESLAMIRRSDQGQQNECSEPVSCARKSDFAELKVSNVFTTQEKSSFVLANESDKNAGQSSRQKTPPLRSPENGSTLQILKISEKGLDSANGTARKNTLHEEKERSQPQNAQAENLGKECVVPMKASRSDDSASTANPIADLKRRIAAIEKNRDLLKQQRSKRQKTTANQDTRALARERSDVENKHFSYVRTGEPESWRRPQTLKSDNRERGTQGDRGASQKLGSRGGKRYYSSGTLDMAQNKRVSVQDNRNGDIDLDTKVQESESHASLAKDPSTSENVDVETSLRLPDDNAERRYIDDLKLELEQKTKELLNERDRTEQLRTAEIAIAEAQAKLNFTRSRVSALQDELRKAEQEVLNAEEECRQRERVVAHLRFANFDISTDIAFGQDGPIDKARFADVVDSDVLSTTLDITRETDREEEIGQEEGMDADFVLGPSPYSPSVGDNFTSCLRTLRAYILRIPRHSKAKDRIAGGILSPTWGGELDPMKAICPQELRGQCSSKACEFQHLKVFKAPKDRALQVIHLIETMFSKDDKQKEKSIVNARIAIHEGKDATKTLFSLISTLSASSKTIPYSCEAN